MKKGWPVTRLGDLTDLVTKGTTPTSIGHAFVEEGINFVKVESITTTGQFIKEKFAHITPACHNVLGRSQLKAGDILFSIAGALGRTAFVTDDILPANTNQALSIIRLKRDARLLPQFVLKALETGVVLEQIEKFKGGVAQQNLSLAQVRDFQIALPPLPEQQRIVGILDEAFEGIALAKANAEKNLQNARALFESHLQSVFTRRGKGWVEKSLGDVCETTQGVQIPKNLHFKAPGENRKRYLYISDFDHDENLKYVDDIFPQKRVTENDLIVVNTGATAGKIFRGIDGVLSNNLFKVTLNHGIDGEFLYYFVTSSLFKEHQKKIVKGTANPHMGHENFKSTPANIPPLDVQLETVTKLDALSAETKNLESIYQQKLASLEALKKSLLHQAFTGKL